jgi:beta-glucosidase
MMVLHHWCNPLWFRAVGGWESKESIPAFADFARRLIDEFGSYVTWWNTFNEPNLYATFSYGIGEFPPYSKDVFKSVAVIRNMAEAHERICDYIKQKFPLSLTGLSQNCVFFSADNLAGVIPSRMADYWYTEYLPGFFNSCDFIGLSYYAKLSFDPFPVSFLQTPEKFVNGRAHDDIWEYFPEGIAEVVMRCWTKFGKPIIITENGVCTNDDTQREKAIRDYMKIIHSLLERGVNISGYFHWSAWDNFEWTLGPTYKFGLYSCDPVTRERTRKRSAELFARLAYEGKIDL